MARRVVIPFAFLVLALALAGCQKKEESDPAAGAPPPAKVEREQDSNIFKVDHPEKFPTVAAAEHVAAPELKVTGTVTADVSRNIPVISVASGRIVEVKARLGDKVTKGQLILRVQSADISQAFSDYRQAVADQALARTQLDRAKLLYDKGAIAKKDLEVAEDVDTKAKVTVENTLERIRVLGGDVNNPKSIVDVYAPASGVITDQQVTTAAGTQGLASPNAFTISDLSEVWVVCDVYENDLPFIHEGESAEIRLNAYPDMVLKGRVAVIAPTLDANLRTAKVRLEVHNPGMLRLGMFVTATFFGPKQEQHATVPATAILHLHDRDWVYEPQQDGRFRRVEVVSGKMLANNQQEILSGVKPGQNVVANALVLQNASEQ